LERPARYKRSILFGQFICYEEKMFENTSPGTNPIKLFSAIMFEFS
jgi:hypothetical protein